MTARPGERALVVLSSGIGNVIRWTPIIRVLKRRGYIVHVWLKGVDYPESAALLLGDPDVDFITFHDPATDRNGYSLTCLSYWAKDTPVTAGRVLRPDESEWRAHGDSASVRTMAMDLGWSDPIPAPICARSEKRFGFDHNTVAFHPGCKPGWPWKRWPHFAELARHFGSVVVVGSDHDEDPTHWPTRVVNFRGKLSLPDTVSILAECGALVCNDSGLSHVAAALGVPTFPIYGITRARREAMPLSHVFPIENRQWCHGGCETLRHNARTCPGELLCLKRLTASQVATVVKNVLPHLK